jgi:hypothetical protein
VFGSRPNAAILLLVDEGVNGRYQYFRGRLPGPRFDFERARRNTSEQRAFHDIRPSTNRGRAVLDVQVHYAGRIWAEEMVSDSNEDPCESPRTSQPTNG